MKNVFVALIALISLCAGLPVFPDPARAAEDFSGQRLLAADFTGKSLRGALFDGSVLRGAVFGGADLTGASFRKADVRGVTFKGAKGLGSDPNAFRDALYSAQTVWPDGFSRPVGAALIEGPAAPVATQAQTPAATQAPAALAGKTGYVSPSSGVNMQGKKLKSESFADKYLKGANYEGATLEYMSFQRANLEGASFRGARIKYVRFEGAKLRGADFTGALLDGPYFAGADLTGANFENQTLLLGGWAGYSQPPQFDPDLTYGYDLKQMMQAGDTDHRYNNGLILKGANLKQATIAGHLEGVDFRKADLRGADLSDTTKAERRFFKDAVYDSGTIWPKDFDPASAGAVKGEDLPPRAVANTPEAASDAAAPVKLESHGIAGYSWTITSPGESEGRRIYIYRDGAYSWLRPDGEIEQSWKPVDGATAIILQQGLKGEDWTATPSAPEKLTLRAVTSGGTLEAERSAALSQ